MAQKYAEKGAGGRNGYKSELNNLMCNPKFPFGHTLQ